MYTSYFTLYLLTCLLSSSICLVTLLIIGNLLFCSPKINSCCFLSSRIISLRTSLFSTSLITPLLICVIVFCSSLISLIAKLFGYSLAFLSAGSIIILIVLFPLIIKEIKIVKKGQRFCQYFSAEWQKVPLQIYAERSVHWNSNILWNGRVHGLKKKTPRYPCYR